MRSFILFYKRRLKKAAVQVVEVNSKTSFPLSLRMGSRGCFCPQGELPSQSF